MSLGSRLQQLGGVLILGAVPFGLLAIPINALDLMEPQAAFATFIFGGMVLGLVGLLSAVVGAGMQMGSGGVSSIPDDELTPDQQLRKRELAIEEQRQQRESARAIGRFFFGSSGPDGGNAGTKNERDGNSLTDSLRQTKNKYTGAYVTSPKCPNCGSQATAGVGNDEEVFQCDKCGNVFETRARTRRDVNLNVEE